MEGAPKNINLDDIIQTIVSIDGVNEIHDLHVWTITSGKHALSCHAVVNGEKSVDECQVILRTIEEKLKNQGIGHITIQLETNDHPHDDILLCQHAGKNIRKN